VIPYGKRHPLVLLRIYRVFNVFFSGVASYGAPGRVPPRLPTSHFRGARDHALQNSIDSYNNSTRTGDIVQCVERDLVQAAAIDKIVDRFSALGDSRDIVLN